MQRELKGEESSQLCPKGVRGGARCLSPLGVTLLTQQRMSKLPKLFRKPHTAL